MSFHFEKCMSTRECKKNIPFDFIVPAGCRCIIIELSFTPHKVEEIENMLTLTLFDPRGFRGAGHRAGPLHRAVLSESEATPGYIAGPLPEGVWTAVIDNHMIMPGMPVTASLDITFPEVCEKPKSLHPGGESVISSAAGSGPGWYKGDFHVHTTHSDSEITISKLSAMARESKLDFIFLTDHNTASGLGEFKAAAPDYFLAAGGIELTTFWGHALCLGADEWIDWRVSPGTGDINRIAEDCIRRGMIFVIAHPQADGDPGCTGCSWRYGDMMPGNAQAVEIWNSSWDADSNNESALQLWYDWLNQGLRIAATAGTDAHSGKSYLTGSGCGFNVVYAEELSEKALLKSLGEGRLYLSSGPEITFIAHGSDGRIYGIGDTVKQEALFSAAWKNCPQDAVLRIIENGRLRSSVPASGEGEYTWKSGPDKADWTVMEIRDSRGAVLAVSNPVFLNIGRQGGNNEY